MEAYSQSIAAFTQREMKSRIRILRRFEMRWSQDEGGMDYFGYYASFSSEEEEEEDSADGGGSSGDSFITAFEESPAPSLTHPDESPNSSIPPSTDRDLLIQPTNPPAIRPLRNHLRRTSYLPFTLTLPIFSSTLARRSRVAALTERTLADEKAANEEIRLVMAPWVRSVLRKVERMGVEALVEEEGERDARAGAWRVGDGEEGVEWREVEWGKGREGMGFGGEEEWVGPRGERG